jgi:hypothetical protein
VPAARCQATEDRCTGGIGIQMEGLRIEFDGKLLIRSSSTRSRPEP